jgi:hypothetical protein
MHGRQEWFRYARDPLWERLNGFAALGRGIAMLAKNKNRSSATFRQDGR